MSTRYEIEFAEPKASRCDCCGGLSVWLTRFVHRDGDAFAVYYASYATNHPEAEIALLVSLGEWAEGSDPSQRAAFFCRVRNADETYEVMLDDADDAPWSQAGLMGQMLSQSEARSHPLKATAFEVLDHAFEVDPSLVGFLQRVRCGDPAAPLERTFRAPDVIHQLGDDAEDRVELGPSFAKLDGARFFVRCLLPIPVEGYAEWCVGTWVEVTERDFERSWDAWDDPERYRQLRFSGMLANDLGADLDLPAPLGSQVFVEVSNPESAPRIGGAEPGALAERLARPWLKAEFEAYAIGRGLL